MHNSAGQRAVFGGLLLVSFVAALDSTVVSTALYRIGASLHGLTAQAWVTTAFLIMSTVTTPVYGRLADQFGRTRLFGAAVVVFLAGSVLCSLATSMTELAMFRAVAGAGAGGVFSLTSAITGVLVPPRERARYGSYFISVFAVASVLGPLVGGALAGAGSLLGVAGWRWIFLVNVPVGAVALAVVARAPWVGGRTTVRRVDHVGVLLLVVALVPLLLVAQWGQQWGWGAGRSVACYVIGLCGVAGFLLAERAAGDGALLALRLFGIRAFAVGTAQAAVQSVVTFGVTVLLPLYLQLVRGYPPTEAGLLTLPVVVGMVLAAQVAGQVTARTGRYKVLPVTGAVLLIAGAVCLAGVGVGGSLVPAVAGMFVFGAGQGLYQATISMTVQNAVAIEDIGVASSAAALFRQIGGTVGIAGLLSVVYSVAGATISRHALDDTSFLARLPPAAALPIRERFVTGLSTAFAVAAAVSVAALVLAVMVREVPLRGRQPRA
ncbi:MAG TPA: MFS transporter [Pseudonocardiaceae bacterium]|nr:MFS transporter [Pseudonocardiaceae bacterium]